MLHLLVTYHCYYYNTKSPNLLKRFGLLLYIYCYMLTLQLFSKALDKFIHTLTGSNHRYYHILRIDINLNYIGMVLI